MFTQGIYTYLLPVHLVLYPQAVVMPVAALQGPALLLLLNVSAVHPGALGHRVIGEAGLLPVSDLPRLMPCRG